VGDEAVRQLNSETPGDCGLQPSSGRPHGQRADRGSTVRDEQRSLFDNATTFQVRVIRSRERKRTIAASLVGDLLTVRIPARLTKAQEAEAVDDMVARFTKRIASNVIDLESRALTLGKRYRLPAATSVRWVSNMTHRWGSCTPTDGSIRISQALVNAPLWVLDAVIMHELCHLVEGNHSERFWALANQYPLMERARGWLIAKSGDIDD
jgi:predicted metal-dependent hydrolase